MMTEQQTPRKPTVDDPYCEVRDSPGRGLGVYAVRDIAAGTRIIADVPLMIIDHGHYMKADVQAAYEKLSPEAQTKYMTLASAHGQSPSLWPSRIHESVERRERQRIQEQHDARVSPEKTVLSVMMTNAMPWGAHLEGSAVFETACRLNHSCVPNAYFAWNNDLGKETVHATKPISAGEEITVAYCDPLYEDALRRRTLQHYGFQCDCKACVIPLDGNDGTDPTSFAAASSERKYRLREIDQLLGRGFYLPVAGLMVGDENRRIKLLLEEIGLLKTEGLVMPRLGNSYFELAGLCSSKSDYSTAAKAARQGYKTIVTCVGENAAAAKDRLPELEKMTQRLDWLKRVGTPLQADPSQAMNKVAE